MKNLKVLGTGCHKCEKLFENAEAAAKALGIEYKIEKITDIQKITGFGVMMTPALVIDGEVKIIGKVPPIEELKRYLINY